jgi:protein-S-isoprenylcysteine O-methyltransferase Ste14
MERKKRGSRKLWRDFASVIAMALATAGIRLDKLLAHRIMLLGATAALYLWMLSNATADTAVLYFGMVFTARYLFLFGSFGEGGIARWLNRRFGETTGYEIYETITATMFMNSAAAFSTLVAMTPWTGPFAGFEESVISAAGGILSAVGTLINLWAGLIIGADVYYYKDLYLERFLTEFKQDGPYRVLANPMYGIGQSAAYGAAVMSGSAAGIIATAMNQLMMYVFYFTIEGPHVRRMAAGTRRYRSSAAGTTQRRAAGAQLGDA